MQNLTGADKISQRKNSTYSAQKGKDIFLTNYQISTTSEALLKMPVLEEEIQNNYKSLFSTRVSA